MMWMAHLAARSPPRFNLCLTVLPDEAGTGPTPQIGFGFEVLGTIACRQRELRRAVEAYRGLFVQLGGQVFDNGTGHVVQIDSLVMQLETTRCRDLREMR